MATKAETVQETLANDDRIVVHAVVDRNLLPYRDGYWSHTLDIIVYPKQGLYTAAELQILMESLIPDGLVTSAMDRFREGDTELEFGKLYFDENIGQIVTKKELTLTDEALFSTEGFTEGKMTVTQTENLQRRTWVRLYPDHTVAELIYPPEGVEVSGPPFAITEYRISWDALRSIQRQGKALPGVVTATQGAEEVPLQLSTPSHLRPRRSHALILTALASIIVLLVVLSFLYFR